MAVPVQNACTTGIVVLWQLYGARFCGRGNALCNTPIHIDGTELWETNRDRAHRIYPSANEMLFLSVTGGHKHHLQITFLLAVCHLPVNYITKMSFLLSLMFSVCIFVHERYMNSVRLFICLLMTDVMEVICSGLMLYSRTMLELPCIVHKQFYFKIWAWGTHLYLEISDVLHDMLKSSSTKF